MRFENGTLTEATDKIIALAKSGPCCQIVVTPNVDHLVTMRRDDHMREVFERAALRFPDGMPIVWLSRLDGGPRLIERVTGADLLMSVAAAAAREGLGIFMLGGQAGVADLAAKRLCASNPGLRVVGTYSPPFGFEHDEDECRHIVDRVRTAGGEILFVGVGTPKQEKWLARWGAESGANVALGVGAALDFAAGTAKRAPVIVQRSGCEWLWRLVHDPRRLFRRYVVNDSRFLAMALKHLCSGRRT